MYICIYVYTYIHIYIYIYIYIYLEYAESWKLEDFKDILVNVCNTVYNQVNRWKELYLGYYRFQKSKLNHY